MLKKTERRGIFGSKNFDGRFTRALRSSPLRLLDTDRQPYELALIQPENGFTKSAGALLETFLCGFDKRPPRLFRHIDEQGVQTAIVLSDALSESPSEGGRVVFRTVFGATEQMPIAALSYIVPSIRLAEEFVNIQVNRAAMQPEPIRTPRVEFLYMIEAGVRVNGLDRNRVEEQYNLFQEVATSYLKRFHPNIVPSVSFLDDRGITPTLVNNPVFRLSELVIGVFGEHRKTLSHMSQRHGNGNGFRTYAALHPFVHDVVKKNDGASTLVSFGADSEKTFYRVRRMLRPLLRLDRRHRTLPTIQYITSHSTPPYHMIPGGDISLTTALHDSDSVVRNSDVHTPVKRGLDILFSDAGGKADFRDFLKSL